MARLLAIFAGMDRLGRKSWLAGHRGSLWSVGFTVQFVGCVNVPCSRSRCVSRTLQDLASGQKKTATGTLDGRSRLAWFKLDHPAVKADAG